MPHIIAEYTETLSVDMPALLNALHETLATQETISLQAIKTRGIPVKFCIVGDAHQHDKFIHITLRLLPGRDEPLRAAMASALQKAARHHAKDPDISVTVEVVEMNAASYIK